MRKIIVAFFLFVAAEAISAQSQPNYAAQVNAGGPSVVLNFNDATTAFHEQRTNATFLTTGSVTPRVAGFDSDQVNNTAASFTYNSFTKAPNNTLVSYEWTQPFTVQVQIDNLQFTRNSVTGNLNTAPMLISKGDYSGGVVHSQGYRMFLLYDSGGNSAQICVQENLQGGFADTFNTFCTFNSSGWDFPNGYNYNIIWTHDGTGNPITGDNIYVNGTQPGQTPLNGSFSGNQGMVSIALSGGTGYASSTAFTSSGGGANCLVSGVMTSSGGVPASVIYDLYAGTNATKNHGCTSTPTIVLTSPTGTGVTITVTRNTGSMINTSHPLYVMGGYSYQGGGSEIGFGASGDAPMVVDEVAIYPRVVDQYLVQGSFVHTKFFKSLISAKPANPPKMIISEDGCGDVDNFYALQLAIAAHKLGYVRLQAVTDSYDGEGLRFYRQMLDAAGLNHIPVLRSSNQVNTDPGTGLCYSSAAATYNASNTTSTSNYPQAVTVYRKILAGLASGEKLSYMNGGPFRDLYDLLQSSADSISSLTGQQLFDTKVAAAYFQGLGPDAFGGSAYPLHCLTPCDNSQQDYVSGQYVMLHNGAVHLNWFGGTPAATGPGMLHTHTATDPMRINTAIFGNEFRPAWDSLPTLNFLTTAFQGSPVSGTAAINSSTDLTVVTTTNSQHYFYQLSTAATTAQGQLLTWFINSMTNVEPRGQPRAF
jgi:hypothetical protein